MSGGLWNWMNWGDRAGFDAMKDEGRRRPPKRRVYAQDTYLRHRYRDYLNASALDVERNFGLIAWMVRRHLDFVSSFRFICRSGNEEFDKEVERWLTNWMLPENCDVRGRHHFCRLVRLAESTRTLMGDVFFQTIDSGPYRGKLQAIEPDLIRTPDLYEPDLIAVFKNNPRVVGGVEIDKFGADQRYSLTRRSESGNYIFDQWLTPEEIIKLAYYTRIDQVRGVGLLVSVLNSTVDLYETIDKTLMKTKLASAFGLVTYRDSTTAYPGTTPTTDRDGDGIPESDHEIDIGGGVFNIELGQEDKAEILQDKTPATETVNFMQLMVDLIVKALDLPIMFVDESRTNFHGGVAGIKTYQRSCKDKQVDLVHFLDRITAWRLPMAIADGELTVPAGVNPEEIIVEWIPAGMPYWNEDKELAAEITAIGAGLDNPIDAAQRHGRDFKTNVDKIAEASDYADSRGVSLSYGASPAPSEPADDDQPVDETEDETDDEETENGVDEDERETSTR